jgi:Ca2+/Na+ antiporter
MVFYGIILGVAAKLISDGAELLLDLGLPASIIGGLVLPVLGAVPDAAIIVVSGATGSREAAQDNLQVGMGTLAGSTIMLLTLPWLGSLILGRNDIQPNGEAKDETGYDKFSLVHQGITLLPDVLNGIIIMIATVLPYLIVQSADWHFGPTKQEPKNFNGTNYQPSYIKVSAGVTMGFAIFGLLFYLIFQLYDSRSADRRAEKHRQEMLLRRVAARLYLMASSTAFQMPNSDANETDAPNDKSPLVQSEDQPTGGALQKKYYSAWRARGSATEPEEESQPKEEETKDGGAEESPHESKRMIALKSVLQLGIGVALVVVFSDPMVSVLTSLTDKNNHSYLPIKAFYVSFVVTPICSNASELVSSLIFAMKKKKINISMTYAQLYGAAIMNNTLCLAVFMALVIFRNLQWEYSAETLVIVVVEIVVGLIGYRKTYRIWLGIPIALLYFVSIGMVAFLESSVVGWR